MRLSPTAALLILAPGLWLSPAAVAQRSGGKPLLDLGAAPHAPEPGTGASAIALAESLDRDAAALESKGPREHAQAAVRRLAQKLAVTGEAAGEAGSERLVLARTLGRGLPEIDQTLAGLTDATAEARLALIAHDLLDAVAALDSAGADTQRTVRDGLASLAQIGPALGTPPDPAREWTKVTSLDPPVAAALESAERFLTEAEGWPAYRASAARLRTFLREAGVAVATPPPWLGAPARKALAEQTRAAAAALVEPTTRAQAGPALERVARLARLVAALDHLEDSAPTKKTRAAAAAFIATPAGEGDAERLDAASRLLDLIQARSHLPEEKTLARQVRPAWRSLLAAARQSELKLLPLVDNALAHPGGLSDPAVLAAMASHKQNLDDLRQLATLNGLMTEGSPPDKEAAVIDRWKRIADRVIKLGQDMAKPSDRDAAVAMLREMTSQVDRFGSLPGEAELRDATKGRGTLAASWGRVTGGKGEALLTELSDRRSGWLQGWDRAGYAGTQGDIQRLEGIRALLLILRDAAAADPTGPAYPVLQATTGWELSPEAMTELSGDLVEKCAKATTAMAAGDAEQCSKLVTEIRDQRCGALLAGRLARDPGTPANWAAVEACGGCAPPCPGWTDHHGAEVMSVCRYAEELPSLKKASKADGTAAFVNSAARAVLEALDAGR
jgi:hypothetical protein